jgi:hypothetical protein
MDIASCAYKGFAVAVMFVFLTGIICGALIQRASEPDSYFERSFEANTKSGWWSDLFRCHAFVLQMIA